MSYIDNIQQILKPQVCTYMGIYIIRYLKEAVEKGNSMDPYMDDFCANAKETVKSRLLFFNDIYNLNVGDTTFLSTCEENLRTES